MTFPRLNNISENEVHIWKTSEGAMSPDIDLMSDLPSHEKKRAQQFIAKQAQHEYILGHAMLRRLLSYYIPESEPQSFEFVEGEFGKPSLKNPNLPLHFNISHSGGQVIVGFSLDRIVGVDVELMRRSGDLKAVAEHSFAPAEFASLHGLSELEFRRKFFQFWTLKESYIKARGYGLQLPLDKFAFRVQEARTPSGKNEFSITADFVEPILDSTANWHFKLFDQQPDIMIALTVEAKKSGEPQILMREFDLVPAAQKAS